MLKAILVSLGLLLAGAAAAADLAPDLSTVPTQQLIDRLTELDQSTIGISGGGNYYGFIAEDKPPQFASGLLPVEEITTPPVMRELVRRGGNALPLLLAHLDDARPTQMTVGGGDFPYSLKGFNDEYDRRSGIDLVDDACLRGDCPEFDTYTVSVGDVCEVLVGQIVGRYLSAVRYQPSGLLFVNSPVKTPALATRIRADWGGVDAVGLEAYLLSELTATVDASGIYAGASVSRKQRREMEADFGAGRTETRHYAALTRLRFYYPQTYAGLTGANAAERDAFEARERELKAAGY